MGLTPFERGVLLALIKRGGQGFQDLSHNMCEERAHIQVDSANVCVLHCVSMEGQCYVFRDCDFQRLKTFQIHA